MSNYLAIRGVTETLRSLLVSQMEVKAVTISVGPPDLEPESDQKKKRLNLYLYKVIENGYLKNQEIPGEGYPAAYGHPPLSLILYYLLTAFPDVKGYNETHDLIAHEILGDAMRVFHDYPILTDAMEVPPGSGSKLLHTSLQNQFEKVKITLEPLNTEELTKIWMGLNNPYRLSVGYAASVVQIESQKPRRLARPVKTRKLHLRQLRRPLIYDLLVAPSGSIIEMPPATARIGDTLKIKGVNFSGLLTQVIVGGAKIDVMPQSDNTIEFIIPDDPKLQPGPTSLGVSVKMATEVVKGGYDDLGTVEIGENVVTSNQVALMLVPKIEGISPTSGDHTVTLTINGKRLYKKELKSFVLLGDIAIKVEETSATETNVKVSLESLKDAEKGDYPVRIRVKGGESLEEDKTFKLT